MPQTPFEDLKPTTMTLIISLAANINYVAAFRLIPITYLDLSLFPKIPKGKVPHCPVPGSVLSIRHMNQTRGFVRNTKSALKNSTSMDMSLITKNVSMKLSTSSIQMTGAASLAFAKEATTYLMNILQFLQNSINYLNADLDRANRIFEFVKNDSKGTKVSKTIKDTISMGTFNFIIDKFIDDHELVYNFNVTKVPSDMDVEVVRWLYGFVHEFQFTSDLDKIFKFIMHNKTILTYEITDNESLINSSGSSMVNFNYNLGVEIDRLKLHNMIMGKNGFLSRFNNAMVPYVAIELPYEVEPDSKKTKKKKIPHHTFLIYKSGAVTQSGPDLVKCREAYNLFFNTLESIGYDKFTLANTNVTNTNATSVPYITFTL